LNAGAAHLINPPLQAAIKNRWRVLKKIQNGLWAITLVISSLASGLILVTAIAAFLLVFAAAARLLCWWLAELTPPP